MQDNFIGISVWVIALEIRDVCVEWILFCFSLRKYFAVFFEEILEHWAHIIGIIFITGSWWKNYTPSREIHTAARIISYLLILVQLSTVFSKNSSDILVILSQGNQMDNALFLAASSVTLLWAVPGSQINLDKPIDCDNPMTESSSP